MSQKRVIDREFKINAVRYKEEHPELSFEACCKNLDISYSSLRRWIKEFKSSVAESENEVSSNVFRGSGNYSSNELKEIARLKKENKDLKDALEILKKAIGIMNSQ